MDKKIREGPSKTKKIEKKIEKKLSYVGIHTGAVCRKSTKKTWTKKLGRDLLTYTIKSRTL